MNQYTVPRCPAHDIRLKLIYTYDRRDKRNRQIKVFEDPRCVECMRDHDKECKGVRGSRPKVKILKRFYKME